MLPEKLTPEQHAAAVKFAEGQGFTLDPYDAVMADGKAMGFQKRVAVAPPAAQPITPGAAPGDDAEKTLMAKIAETVKGLMGKGDDSATPPAGDPAKVGAAGDPAKVGAAKDDKDVKTATFGAEQARQLIADAMAPLTKENLELKASLESSRGGAATKAITELINQQQGLTPSGRFVLESQNIGPNAVNKWETGPDGQLYCKNPVGLVGVVIPNEGMQLGQFMASMQTKSAMPIHEQTGRKLPGPAKKAQVAYDGTDLEGLLAKEYAATNEAG